MEYNLFCPKCGRRRNDSDPSDFCPDCRTREEPQQPTPQTQPQPAPQPQAASAPQPAPQAIYQASNPSLNMTDGWATALKVLVIIIQIVLPLLVIVLNAIVENMNYYELGALSFLFRSVPAMGFALEQPVLMTLVAGFIGFVFLAIGMGMANALNNAKAAGKTLASDGWATAVMSLAVIVQIALPMIALVGASAISNMDYYDQLGALGYIYEMLPILGVATQMPALLVIVALIIGFVFLTIGMVIANTLRYTKAARQLAVQK